MSLKMRWVGDSDLERVAQTRLLCYGDRPSEIDEFRKRISCNGRGKPGDYLLAERDGRAAGTATQLGMTMWMRGAAFPCQGVAYVGTVKTERRKGTPESAGVASQLMWETLRRARDEGCVLSALCPWRASFYEHFGYGLMERRCDWTVPLSLMPSGDCSSIQFLDWNRDGAALRASHQRGVEAGQCDLERPAERWEFQRKIGGEGEFVAVDRNPDGQISGWLSWQYQPAGEVEMLKVWHISYESIDSLRRILCFLGSLRDQYFGVTFPAPIDLQVHRLLKETQVPHRPVTHLTAKVSQYNRLQTRILDHRRLLEGIKWPRGLTGQMVIGIHETEGHVSKVWLDLTEGRASAAASEGTAEVEMNDRTWAAVACGDLPASAAARMGLVSAKNEGKLAVLDALAAGPAPFCRDYF